METLVASFFLGLASAASPCLLPLYPAFLALLATRRGDPSRIGTGLLGLAVVLGVVTALVAVAAVVTAISISLSGLLSWIVPISTVVLVVLGVMLILGRNPFMTITTVQMPLIRRPLAQARSSWRFSRSPSASRRAPPELPNSSRSGWGSERR